MASYFNSLSMDDRIEVDEFLLEVSAEVAALRCTDEPSGAHGDGGGGSSSEVRDGLLRPKPNLLDPAREFSGVLAGVFSLCSGFLVNKPMLKGSQERPANVSKYNAQGRLEYRY
jgi:hypothetical protein